jgi:hypothetical protein
MTHPEFKLRGKFLYQRLDFADPSPLPPLRQGFDTVRAANNGGTPVRDGRLYLPAQSTAHRTLSTLIALSTYFQAFEILLIFEASLVPFSLRRKV